MKILKEITLLAITAFLLCSCGGNERRSRRSQTDIQQQQEVEATATDNAQNITEPQPEEVSSSDEPTPSNSFNINLYIENSGSMYGYVDGSHDFKNSMYEYLSDINAAGITESISLNFINSQIIKKGGDITAFFDRLNNSSALCNGGGKSGTTDIAEIIEMVAKNSGNNDVAIIVSDFIFSPGRGKNANEYLKDQRIKIKNIFTNYLKANSNAGVMFWRLTSNFSGPYYNRENAKTMLNNVERPYYMLVFGNKNALKSMRESVPESKINVKNFFIAETNFDTPDYSVQQHSGEFERSRTNAKHAISNAKKGRDGNMTFAVNVDFSKSLLDENYLLSPDNYSLSDKQFELSIQKNGSNFLLKYSSPVVKKTTLKTSLLKKIPNWINDYDDPDGLDINTAMDKTYGLKTIVGGIAEAFNINNTNSYTELSIDINK